MSNRNDQIRENIAQIKVRIAAAAERSGRPADSVSLLAVTKNVPLTEIRMAADAGIKAIGESKIQDAKVKFFHLGPNLSWHMLGHLQTNKVRQAAVIFDMIQSIDSTRLADALDREAGLIERHLDVLVEVNISGEIQKFGVAPDQALDLVRHLDGKSRLRVKGFMAMAPYVADPEIIRPLFRGLGQLFQRAKNEVKKPEQWTVLSMGMTNDFEVAVEEGATLVRIGTGIFSTPASGGRSA
jgi:pyridoxal phosphate enzyme (YggS family)